MQIDKHKALQRIDELIHLAEQAHIHYNHSEVISGTINVLELFYGNESNKTRAFLEQHAACCKQKDPNSMRFALEQLSDSAKGVLQSIKSELETNLIGNIHLQAQGGIFGDFITLARHAFDESKDVAAVLISAALEDTLKRYALQTGLDVAQADMSEVINALKSKGLLKGPQASVVQSYVQLRNKAFHAEWDKIDKETVNSAISFTETFLLEHFS